MALKVKDLAKELGVTSEAVIEQLRNLYVDVEDEKSEVDPKIAGLVKIKLGGFKPAKKAKKETKPKKTKEAKEEKEPKKAKTKKKKKEEEEKKEEKPKKKAEAEAEKVKEPKEEKAEEPQEKKPSVRPVQIVKRASEEEKAKEGAKATVRKIRKVVKPKPVVKKAKKKSVAAEGKTSAPAPVKKAGPIKIKLEKGKKAEPVKEEAAALEMPAHEGPLTKVQIQVPASIRTIAVKIERKPNELLQYMMRKGAFININQDLDEETVRSILKDFGYELEIPMSMEEELLTEHHELETAETVPRAPIVTFMGHVDHGKTSLLDYIRKTMVAAREKGGITQHIGAYRVDTAKGSVTFLDTPGHEAFTSMRARGANITDVVVLVVAADDGVMPQTKEAIDHARAANVPIVVAINKCDLPGANPDQVKAELQKEDLASEDWGGKTVMVEVSAKTGEGVDDLVEMLMLESELLELKASPSIRARGVVLEGKKTPGQGIVASLLVKNGTLNTGDIVLTGIYYGKVKAMINDRGEKVSTVPPATPVEVLGLQGVPSAGDEFFVVKDEKKARTLSLIKQAENKKKGLAASQRVSLEDLHARIAEGEIKELKIVLKGDVQGSVEALQSSLKNIKAKEVKVNIIHAAVGNINESDVMLALVSDAIIIGFHVKVDTKAEELARSEKVDIHVYDVIYKAIEDVEAGMEGLLEPEEVEVFQGRAQVREVFSTKTGKVAGCAVTKGTIHRKDRARVKRGEETIFEGELDNLKRFKDDVKEVKEGFECGISMRNFNNLNKNDVIETYIIEKRTRRLDKK